MFEASSTMSSIFVKKGIMLISVEDAVTRTMYKPHM